MKILIADDDPVSLRLLERMLQNGGYEVITATDGLEAVEVLSRPDGPRLALLDWMMPQLDGPGVCQKIRERYDSAYIYILLVTSKQSSEDVVTGLGAGADDYVTKPCDPAELKARLQTGRRVLELQDKLVEAREEMRFKATHDSLTMLWDRGAIMALVKSELSRSQRENTPVSLLLCDVDHFKRINDGYGHPVGDEVLRQVSERLRDMVRPYDSVGRYGGEEFLIVLGGCSEDNLRKRADHIRNAICRNPFLTSAGPIQVSISAGAITIERWDRSSELDLYLKEADMALYRAKARGRNRVEFAESLVAA